MENETSKSVSFKVTIPEEMFKEVEAMRGSTTKSQLFMDYHRYAIHQAFNPNKIKPNKTNGNTTR